MAYTPPLSNAVNFDFGTGYTAPSRNNVNFNLGGAVVIELDVPALETNASIDTEILWYRELEALENVSSLGFPDFFITVLVTEHHIDSTLVGNAVPRLRFPDLQNFNTLFLEFINEVPQGVTPVSPRPFELSNTLSEPAILQRLNDIELSTTATLAEEVLIFANGTAQRELVPFESLASLEVMISNTLSPDAFENTYTIDLLAIVMFPVGDQYTVVPEFNLEFSLAEDFFATSIVVADDLSINNTLELGSIYAGALIVDSSLTLLNSIEAAIFPVILLTEFNSSDSIDVDIQPQLFLPGLASLSTLDADIFDGEVVQVEPLETRGIIETDLLLTVELLPLSTIGQLDISTISEFIGAPALNVSSALEVENIRLFNFDNSLIFYYCVLTGTENGLSDIELDISTFQTRQRNNTPSFLSATVIGTARAEEIAARSDGQLQIFMGYRIDEATEFRRIIAESSLDQVDQFEGPFSQSIVLTGYEERSFTAKTITLQNPIFYSLSGGNKHYRFATPEITLNAGDTVIVDSDQLTVDTITIYIKNLETGPFSTMEITGT